MYVEDVEDWEKNIHTHFQRVKSKRVLIQSFKPK